MARSERNGASARVFTLILVIVTVAALYFAQQVFIPFALATLVSFLLGPVVTRLERWGLHRILAAALVVILALTVVGSVASIVARQVIDLAGSLPQYEDRILKKIHTLKSQGEVFSKARQAVDDVIREISGAGPAADRPQSQTPQGQSTQNGPDAQQQPIPVQVVETTSGSLTAISTVAPPVLELLANAGIITLFVLFMLINREDLRNRLIRLIGPRQISATTQALDEASVRVSRYLRMQLIINSAYGIAAAIGLYFLGLPSAILLGLMAGLSRYIPYIGPWFGAAIPFLLSLAVSDSMTVPLLTIGLFVVLEVIANNLEPVLFGATTGLSTIGILAAAVFWTWLWGPVGLVLATPMTVCIAVIGRYVPHLEFLSVLLSDEPVLTPAEQYYQRLLAEDHEEANKLVQKIADEKSLEDLYDNVILPALVLIEHDRHRNTVEESKLAYVLETIRETVEDLGERRLARTSGSSADSAAPEAAPTAQRCVMCLPARDEADELAALMLTQLLEARGYCARFVSVKALASEMLEQVAEQNITAVCISAVPPFAVAHARYLCKRLNASAANLRIVVGLWHLADDEKKVQERLGAACADKVVTTLRQALEQL